MEWCREMIRKNSNIKDEGDVAEIHPIGDLAIVPFDVLGVGQTRAIHG